jgi:hypothetical protein
LEGGSSSWSRCSSAQRRSSSCAEATGGVRAAPRSGSRCSARWAETRTPPPTGQHVVATFPRGRAITATAAKTAPPPTFGQPTLVAVAGWGFEPDLRIDPSNQNRIYMSSLDSGDSDTSWIWRSLDRGQTFNWVPAAAPLNGDSPTSASPAPPTRGRTFPARNSTGVPDAGVDRQWYALAGDPTAGGSLYLATDEVGAGAVQCGSAMANNVLVIYRSPVAGAGATPGLQFGPPFRITQPGICDEGIMGNDEVSPVATTKGQPGVGAPAAPAHHVFVITTTAA